uniref:Roadblock/LAMTOR2 domain-containing protein n=1 Tax=Timema genevievae TaxID=629358 RepID=A0A7R9PJP8_TIMGE|nr:unnamed protein product [Timema genevievae]
MLAVPIKTTLSDARTTHYVALLNHLTNRTRWVLKDLDPTNDLTSLRIRSKKHEIIVVPDHELLDNAATFDSGGLYAANSTMATVRIIPDRDSNLGIPVLSSLVQHETSALANYATEVIDGLTDTLSGPTRYLGHDGCPPAQVPDDLVFYPAQSHKRAELPPNKEYALIVIQNPMD